MKTGMNLLLWSTHITEDQFHLFETLKKTGYDGVRLDSATACLAAIAPKVTAGPIVPPGPQYACPAGEATQFPAP